MRKLLPKERITRLRNLTLLMTGLFLARKVHLSHIVRKWPLPGKLPSLTNRLRRFLNNERVVPQRLYHPIAQCLLARFGSEGEIRLILDITKVGFRYRMLSCSVAYRRRALPLCWSLHRGRKGHVKVAEIKALLEQIRPLMPPQAQVWVLGDSSFGQVELMGYLQDHGWHFVLRSHGHYKVSQAQSKDAPWVPLVDMALAEGQTRYLGAVAFTEKHAYRGGHLVLHWGRGEDEPWYLLSDQAVSPQTLRYYGCRMWTEELYGDLKGHGFDLEATYLNDRGRIERLVLGVCLVYVWLIALGSAVVKRGLRHVVDRKDRRDKSYFRIGWDYLEQRLRLGEPLLIRFQPYL